MTGSKPICLSSQPSPSFLRTGRLSGRLLAALGLFFLLPVTGCFSVKIHRVNRTLVVPQVLDASVEELLTSMQMRYDAVQTMSAAVEIAASEGSEHTGEVKEIPTFSGYLWLRKPADLRVLLLLPVVRSHALDMVSNGTDFKMLIPPKNKAIVGGERVTNPSQNGLENLRPGIIRDALLIPPVEGDQLVDLVNGSREIAAVRRRKTGENENEPKEVLEEPDYDLTVLRIPASVSGKGKDGHILQRVRVVHISRVTLLPYEQDIYENGKVVTKVEYDRYQKIGGIDFPTSILITRPLEEYKLKLDLSKITLNQPQTDDTYVLKIPEGVAIQKM